MSLVARLTPTALQRASNVSFELFPSKPTAASEEL